MPARAHPRPAAVERICWNPGQAAAFLRHNHTAYSDQFADPFEVLLVQWNLTAVDNNQLFLGHPKTRASRNWVSLSPRVTTAPERQQAQAAHLPDGAPLDGLVFCRADGSPLRPQSVLTALRPTFGRTRPAPDRGARRAAHRSRKKADLAAGSSGDVIAAWRVHAAAPSRTHRRRR
ncbi:hypothetical protein [Streptomyces misionensis]|uniref:hypothetical protein n=1 Tax=Streptomyces misionensis TaxID=67331 RepID=UPI00396BD6BE